MWKKITFLKKFFPKRYLEQKAGERRVTKTL